MADKPQYAYFNGEIVPIAQAKVSVMTHALNYGTAVFGGLRGYWNADHEQLYVFRPVEHFTRLRNSASLMRMEVPQTPEELRDILRDLLRAENYHQNVYIRPLAYKSDEKIGVRLHDIGDALTIFAMPMGDYVSLKGLHCHISAWRRVDDNAIPARGKVTGAYANSALIKSDAVLSGYDEALVLNEDGHVSEASAANVFIVRDGVVITPPINANVLEGIVRRSLITLLRDEMGLEVLERNIDRTELYLADEMFLCGTGVQLAGVTQVDHRNIGSGEIGPVTDEIGRWFMDVMYGRVEKYREWLSPVYETETVTG
ncbi:MAG: branched-chain amino acid transaminase [Chloroflexota bacterium]